VNLFFWLHFSSVKQPDSWGGFKADWFNDKDSMINRQSQAPQTCIVTLSVAKGLYHNVQMLHCVQHDSRA
jgi:hypothetical protein